MSRARSVGPSILALTLAACTSGATLPNPTATAQPSPTATAPSSTATTPTTAPTTAPAATPTAAPSAAPTAAPLATPKTTALTDFTVGAARPVIVAVPSGYDANQPAPLLVMLHGYGSSGAQHERYFELAAAADERRMLYAHPDGTRDSGGNRFWNATDACCDFEASGVDDAEYLAGVVEEIQTVASVDPKRIYIVGHSNGGFMSHAMACSHADLVAAIVSFAGMAPADPADCPASEPVTILQLHGDADDVVQYEGGQLEPDEVDAPGETMAPFPSVDETAALWLDLDGCSGLVKSPAQLDVEARIDGPTGPAEAKVRRSRDCQPGGHVEVWTIPGGGHDFALSSTFPALILEFLLAHPKP